MIWELLISHFIVVLTIFIYIVCYKTIIKVSLNFKIYKLLIIAILAIIIMVNNLYVKGIFKTIICYLCILSACKIWLNRPLKETIYYTLILSIISLLTELITSRLLSLNFRGIAQINRDYFAKSVITIIMAIAMYFIIMIKPLAKAIKKLEKTAVEHIKYEFLLFIILILSNFLVTLYHLNYSNNELYLLSIIIVILIFYLLCSLLHSNFTKENLKIKNKFLQDNIKNYEIIADDYAELRHNLNADFLAIRSIADEKVQMLIDTKINKYNKNYGWIAHVGKIPKGIQGMLYLKLYELKRNKLNAEINCNLTKDISKYLSSKNYSVLCDILDVTINNALEASIKSKEKAVYIDMLEENNALIIKIMNTFNDEIDLESIGKRHYSTKKLKSGIGLNYINKFNKRNIAIKKEIVNNIFIISLSISLN